MQIRVYYEDTDCGGVVYYANFLRYFERARTEFLRERGFEVAAYAAAGLLFVVSHAAAGTRTYMKRLGVKDVIGNYHIFQSTDNWGEETESRDFAVRRFNAALDSGAKLACFGFVHFSGHVAGATGYRHLISGYACDFSTTPPTDARIDKLVGSIDYDF